MGTLGYLLDTHTFLWAVRGNPKLSNAAKEILENAKVEKFLSSVSAYEIMNKHRVGKLTEFEDVANNYFYHVKTFRASKLPISEYHAHYAGEFEWEHRDPFDRLLAAQAYLENLTLITNDPAFETLPWVSTIW